MTDLQARKVAEYHDVDYRTFTEKIQKRYLPAILKGFVNHWPAARLARQSNAAICKYLTERDNGTPVDVRLFAPEENGRLFYNKGMTGFNFENHKAPVSELLARLAYCSQMENPPTLVVQCSNLEASLPRFALENPMPFPDIPAPPMLWIGNHVVTPAHFDGSENIACVISGRRRFTMFPPEQIGNLYIGPVDFGPTQTPISLVEFENPDFEKFPRFRQALEAAHVAELEPGDALYLPSLWWHHVESFDSLNIMVNYWWNNVAPVEGQTSSPFDCMTHCIKNMKNLSPEYKKAWAAMFNHYIFNTEYDPAEHIPDHKKGILK